MQGFGSSSAPTHSHLPSPIILTPTGQGGASPAGSAPQTTNKASWKDLDAFYAESDESEEEDEEEEEEESEEDDRVGEEKTGGDEDEGEEEEEESEYEDEEDEHETDELLTRSRS